MNRRKFDWLFPIFSRTKFLEEKKVDEGGGSGGGEGSGEKKDENPPATITVEQFNALQEQLKTANGAIAQLQEFHTKVSGIVEVDEETGEYVAKTKGKKKVDDEDTQQKAFERESLIQDATSRAASMFENSRSAEDALANEFKSKDELFSLNFELAKKKIAKVPLEQRTAEVWKRAYSMAQGENLEKYKEHWTKRTKEDTMNEINKSKNNSVPTGSREILKDDGTIDYSKVSLNREEVEAAHKLVAGGFLKNVDEYKRNKLINEGVLDYESVS